MEYPLSVLAHSEAGEDGMYNVCTKCASIVVLGNYYNVSFYCRVLDKAHSQAHCPWRYDSV